MSRANDRAAAYLKHNLDDHWTDAEANAEVLSDEIANLDWACRATAIDWFIWQLGTRMLGEDEAQAIIDRDRPAMRLSELRPNFVDVAQHTLAAVLLRLDDDPRQVTHNHQAALMAVSPLAVHRMALQDWLRTADAKQLTGAMRNLPGTSFLAMAASFDDDIITLSARDAFWSTMLGRDVGL